MNLSTLNNLFANAAIQLRRNGPKILVYSGICGVVGSGIMACKATLKLNDVVVDAKENISDIRKTANPKEVNKELTGAYIRAGVDVALLYLPAVGLGALSIAGILSSHNMLTTRNASLAAAYKAIDTTFRDYRGRVAKRFGADVENRIRYDIVDEEIEETFKNEDGTETTVKKVVPVANADLTNDTARYFMKVPQDNLALGSSEWSNDHSYNLFYIHGQELVFNDILRVRKIVFFNEVCEALGFKQWTKAGQSIGWVYDENQPAENNCVKFTTKTVYLKDKNGIVDPKPVILIEFNVSKGSILEHAAKLNILA